MPKKDNYAVSPIVSTVLLIGICVVFATVMFAWVSGFVFQSGFVPVAELVIYDKNNSSGNVTYIILMKTFRPKAEPKDVKCYICDKDGFVKASFGFPAEINKPYKYTIDLNGTKELNIIWYNGGGMIASYDRLKLTVNNTTGLDVSELKTLATYSLYLRHNPTGGSLIGVVRLD
ncbi:MAG: hypothetical protein QMC98_02820 [Candidatus Thermoplasmatota archaeon]|nr:hypothetical protein [Candidatus Thermoplasmatota archaeon]